jgi:toxin ParE1/3/4
MKLAKFHSQALIELNEAVHYYEERVSGLGIDFRKDVEAAILKIRTAPLRFKSFSKRTRRLLLHRFPYQIVFIELSDHIFIIAIAHGKRRPGYWHGRI